MALLEVENLQLHFRGRDGVNRAVDGLSFHVDEGETLAIVGESGCGKSVTSMSVLRLIPPRAGRIAGAVRFQGRDLLGASPRELQRKRGYEINHCEARQVTADDFRDFDLILAMDWDNLSALQQQCPKVYQHKLMLLMRFANEFEEATVPDPYYGGLDGFGKVLDYLEDACQGVLELVR